MLKDDCAVKVVKMVMPYTSKDAIYRRRKNLECFGTTIKPPEACRRMGRPPKITTPMIKYVRELLATRNDLWQDEVVWEVFVKFDVLVNQSTISRLIKKELAFSKKVNTRVASQGDYVERGVYLEQVRQYSAEMLVYLDESNNSEKTLFRRTSYSAIGLPAFTSSVLRNATRCSLLPALDVNGYLPGTLVVEGSVTQAIYDDWTIEVVLPQCSPFPGPRSVLIMDNCQTHHSERLADACLAAGVRLVYLPAYSPQYNPIELTFHLLKQWMRRHRDLAPEFGCENYKELWKEHLIEASEEWSKGVDVRALFRKAYVDC